MNGHSYLRPHDLAAEHMFLDIAEAAEQLHATGSPEQSRRAVTLIKQDGMSVVLTHLQRGGCVQQHAPGAVTMQVLDGHIRMRLGEQTIDAGRGQVVAFDSGSCGVVEALEESMLLTLAQAAGAPQPGTRSAQPRYWMA